MWWEGLGSWGGVPPADSVLKQIVFAVTAGQGVAYMDADVDVPVLWQEGNETWATRVEKSMCMK